MMTEYEKDDPETVKTVGRSLAWIKKRNPELYQALMKRAKEEGVKVSDILIDALKWSYIDRERVFENMTARDFLTVIEKWNDLQAEMLKYMLELIKVFWVEGFTKYNEIVSAISETIKEEEEKSKGKKKLDPEIMLSIISAIPQTLITLMQSLPQMIQQSLQTQQIQIQTQT